MVWCGSWVMIRPILVWFVKNIQFFINSPLLIKRNDNTQRMLLHYSHSHEPAIHRSSIQRRVKSNFFKNWGMYCGKTEFYEFQGLLLPQFCFWHSKITITPTTFTSTHVKFWFWIRLVLSPVKIAHISTIIQFFHKQFYSRLRCRLWPRRYGRGWLVSTPSPSRLRAWRTTSHAV